MNKDKGAALLIALTFDEVLFYFYWKTVYETPSLYFNTHATLTVFKKSVISDKNNSESQAEIEITSACQLFFRERRNGNNEKMRKGGSVLNILFS